MSPLSDLTPVERSGVGVVVALTVLAAIARYVHGISDTVAFVLAALALAGLAWVVGFCTEQVGKRFGSAITGTLQSTVGNLPEFFVVLFALQARDTVVAQSAILGSILVNALLVLGIVLLVGALRAPDGIMHFSPRLPNDTATLTLAASFLIVLLGIVNFSHDPAAHHTRAISVVGAILLLGVYATWLPRYLRDGAGPAVAEQRTPPRVGLRTSVTLLITAGIGSAFVSDWFVHALEPTIHAAHISPTFAGIVIVAIAGNAVENFAGIYLAVKGQSDLAISVVKTSVAQLVAFLYPLLVLVSLLTAGSLTFALAPVFVGALFGTAILVWQITGDGEATPFEGAALIAMYLIVAVIAAFGH